MGMDISFEKLRIVLGRKNMSRKSIPQVNRGREESSPIFNRATVSRSNDIRVCLGRLSGDKNRVVERRNDS